MKKYKVRPDEDLEYGECPFCGYTLDPRNDKSGTIEECDTFESVKKKLLINHFKAEPSCKETLMADLLDGWWYEYLYENLDDE